MAGRSLVCVALVLASTGLQAAESAKPTWGSWAAGMAYDTGRGINRGLHGLGLPNGLKPEDGGDQRPASVTSAIPVQTLEMRQEVPAKRRSWGDVAYSGGLGAARGADWLYGEAYAGTMFVSPYATRAWDYTVAAGGWAWNGTVDGYRSALPYAGRAWTATLGVANDGVAAAAPYVGSALGATAALGRQGIDLASEGAKVGAVYLPVAIDWAVDAAAAGVTTSIVSGGTMFVCGVAVTPFAAVTAGTAYLVCTPLATMGAMVAMQGLRSAYDSMGRRPSESAFLTGTLVGGLLGASYGQQAAQGYMRHALQSRYTDFSAYSREVRNLTRSNLRAWGPEVASKRASGYHVDHMTSVKCAWTQGMSAATAAGLKNLQYLPARENLSLGAKGC